jgi:acetyltransferase
LGRLVEVARRERMTRVYADILVANVGMQRLCDELGFTLGPMPDAGVIPAELELG